MNNTYLSPAEAEREGFLTKSEVAELQKISDKYRTVFYVIGSRASGTGRNIGQPHLPVGKNDLNTRSDIDVRIDGQADINSGGMLSHEISNVSNGAGTSLIMVTQKPYPPAIEFKPGRG